jgi:amidase
MSATTQQGGSVAKKSTAVASLSAFPFGSAGQLARAVRNGTVSSVELLRGYLDRVDRLNPAINAVVVDDRERALKDARAADRALATGQPVGPLHGVPMTVKESFNIPGQPTTWGFPAFAANVATQDAVAVARLRAAGAVIFGKTNVPLALADFQSYNDVYGTTNNPWDVTRGAGGSSGGSAAALAAGLTGLEYGSDIGGSIRNPAAYNGVYGHKPTYGIVPKRGQTLSEDLVSEGAISVIGPLARSADDLALALKITAGPDLEDGWRLALPAPPTSLAGLRVAVWLDQPDLAPVDDAVTAPIAAAARALEKAGATIDFEARPRFDVAAAHDAYLQLLLATLSARDPAYDRLAERAAALEPGDDSQYAQNLRFSTARHREYVLAAEARDVQRWAWRAFFQDHDVVLAPITATPPFPHDHSQPLPARTMCVNGVDVPYFGQLFWAGLAISAHLPATAVPVGLTDGGLPVGMQIIGDAYRDRTTIWLAGKLAKEIGGFTPPPGW